MSFDLADMLSEIVPESGTQQIEYLITEQIHDDPQNFYSIEGIEDLAANIELAGLQQPILVRPDAEGGYTILSGHRRMAAIRKLHEEKPESWGTVPCLVDRAERSPELRELLLILANKDTRKMSSADTQKQVERVLELFFRLKEQGFEFPGRMRDHVAAACRISKSRLARLNVIREGLAPGIKREYYDKGAIPEETAYQLARLPVNDQVTILLHEQNLRGHLRHLYANSVEARGRELERLSALACPKGGGCENVKEIFSHKFASGDFCYSGNCGRGKGCCYGCDELASCKSSCYLLADEKAEAKEAVKAKRAREAALEARRDAPEIRAIERLWQNVSNALAEKDAEEQLQYLDKARDCGLYFNTISDKELQKRLAGKFNTKGGDQTPFGFYFGLRTVRAMRKLCRYLGVSMDELTDTGEDDVD